MPGTGTRRRGLRARALAPALLALVTLVLNVSVVAESASARGRVLVWSDEFSGSAGTPPNSHRWTHDVGGHGWGNGELEYYTRSTRNAAHDGKGHMVITARRENAGYTCHYGPCVYTSARLITAGRFSQRYGRFEARIKLPAGQGIWPAFWALGDDIGTVSWPDCGEIDVMENIGREPRTVWGSLHGPGYSGPASLSGSYTLPEGQAFSNAFHVFAIEWTPGSVTWFVDGRPYSSKRLGDLDGKQWVFDHPFFLLLNVAVGGGWPGAPDSTTTFPQQMIIDYVRVYRLEGA